MFSYQTYKLLHFLGIFMVMMSLGAMVLKRIDLATEAGGSQIWRKPTMITHGLGLFLILLGGFGMLARLGITNGLPGWVYAKILIWVALGIASVFTRRQILARPMWWLCLILATTAAYLAMHKPI